MLSLRIVSLVSLLLSIFAFEFKAEVFQYFVVVPFVQFIFLIRNSKNNMPLVLFFIYCILFYLYLIPKFIFDIPIVYYKEYGNIQYYNKALLINIVFLSSLGLFLKPFRSNFKFPDYAALFKPNHFVVLLNFIIMVLIFQFGLSGNGILSGVKYGTEDFGSKSILTEYYIIFLIIAYCYSGKTVVKWGLFFFSGIMVLKCLLYGSRVSAILISATVFTLHFANKLTFRKILLCVFGGLILMNFFGKARSGALEKANLGMSSLLRVEPSKEGIISSTQSNMFYGSVVLTSLKDNGIMTTERRLKSFIGFCCRLVVPTSLTFEEGNLTKYGSSISRWGGGAHPASFFYVWFGWFGPVFLGVVIALLFNALKIKSLNRYALFPIFILLITFPRWYGYDPGVIIKMSWVGLVIMIVQENLFFMATKIKQEIKARNKEIEK